MAVNLRLEPAAEQALRERAEATGRSQQEILRTALDAYLGRTSATARPEVDDLVVRGRVRPARTPYRAPSRRYAAASDVSSTEALDRDDRL